MNKVIYVVMGIVMLLSVMACRHNNKQGKNYNEETGVDQQGLAFINSATEGGLTEIKASGLALTQSSSQRVISLAKMMVDDHSKASDELKKIAANKNVTLADTLSKVHEKMIAQLAGKKGAAFDKAYIQMMVIDHEQAVALFKAAATNTSQDIQGFVQKTLPTIQMHLDSANKLCTMLK